MQQHRQIRVIKRDQRAAQTVQAAPAVCEITPESTERKLKTVVSGWVREHQQRSEEYKRMFKTILTEAGFSMPSATRA